MLILTICVIIFAFAKLRTFVPYVPSPLTRLTRLFLHALLALFGWLTYEPSNVITSPVFETVLKANLKGTVFKIEINKATD